mgnify:CR=1 FL=1
MSYAPATLTAVAAYWVAHGGANGGIIRSIARQVKPSYHCGKDGIDYYGRTGANDYSIRNPRDLAGLTNASAALDLSWASADKSGLRAGSNWLVAQIQAGALDTLDFVEVVWSPDGSTVSGWNRWRGNSIIPGYGDASHLWHTHVAWARDTEQNDKLAVFRRYFGEGEADMLDFDILEPAVGTIVVPGAGHSYVVLASGKRVDIAAGYSNVYGTAKIKLRVPLDANPGDRQTGYLAGVNAAFFLASDVTFTPAVMPDTTPFDQADIDEAVRLAIAADRANAKVTVTWE